MNPLASLQARLIAGFAVVVLVALLVSSTVFVFIRRQDQEDRALDRVAAISPAVFGEFMRLSIRGASEDQLVQFASLAAHDHEIRVLLVDQNGTVAGDSERDLLGKTVRVPPAPFRTPAAGAARTPAPATDTPAPREQEERAAARAPITEIRSTNYRPYRAWRPGGDDPAGGLILVTADLPTLRFQPGSRAQRTINDYSLVLAVPEDTISRAWLGLLPGLGLAAAIALPVAVLLAILLARYVTRPLQQLTIAAQGIAAGTFDVAVPQGKRRDEVGRLSQAFAGMVERVGKTHGDMRALVANVSHDLRTPLTSIIGFSRALETGAAGDGETQRMGGVIHEEAERLSRRLNDLLYLSELDAGQAVLDRDEVDVERLIRTVAARIAPAARERGITVEFDLCPGLVVSADGAKIERIVENLVDNAAKFTPDGGRIRLASVDEPGPPTGAAITVANTSPGMDSEEVPLLFNRFYRRDRSRNGRGGSGLGLAIARDLATLHGGSLEAELAGDELRFTVHLPNAHVEAPALIPR